MNDDDKNLEQKISKEIVKLELDSDDDVKGYLKEDNMA